ncbi:hypothetical protein DV736_g1712, partial [Chaetothyriales sp. CBS 134916]
MMPSKIRESSAERRRERRDTASKHDKDRSERKERDRDRHKTTSSHHRKTTTAKDRTSTGKTNRVDKTDRTDRADRADRGARTTSSRASTSPADAKRRSSMPTQSHTSAAADDPSVPLRSESKSSLPYPTVSKEHAKEFVGPRPALAIFTPPTTDLNATVPNAPPSPPLTDQTPGKRKSASGRPSAVEPIWEEDSKQANNHGANLKIRVQTKQSKPNGHVQSSASELPSSTSPVKRRESTKLHKPKPSNGLPQRSVSQPSRAKSPVPRANQAVATTEDETANDSSDATSIAPQQPRIQRPGSKIPPSLYLPVNDSTPLEVLVEHSPQSTATSASQAAPAPPPPPPPPAAIAAPRVDYLLQHGGLHQSVPRSFLLAGKPMAVQQGASPTHPSILVSSLFDPYHQLLDDFNNVISHNGSLAVATGYRSVARRLLDRLEAVFARDISNELCQCCMCELVNRDGADARGISWGEILELVSGRRDLPNWPPFSFMASPAGLGISLEMHVPMQKLDIDVPEEYREHYIKQSRKTKQSVDKWLTRQNDAPTSPPEEVDDETLTFAILTHLPAEQRSTFKDLLQIVDKPLGPPRRAPSPEKGAPPAPTPTPQPRPRPESIIIAGQAICRLYRLATPPRDPETAIFLLNNPGLHNALATLAAVSSDEWDILISGRFDGFLRSGAEDISDLPQPHGPRSASTFAKPPLSRGPTPGYMNGRSSAGHSCHNSATHSHPTTPAAYCGAPIAYDEETEIGTLAEVEREIYLGMEALEDAFEALHVKAEAMRNVLRERSAGLAAAAQRRKGSAGQIEVRMGTPASAASGSSRGLAAGGEGFLRWDAETDDGLGDWDGVSELAPDDSASNISSSRRRRPKRRNERRTPRLEHVGEDDEGDDAAAAADDDDDGLSDGTASPRKQ